MRITAAEVRRLQQAVSALVLSAILVMIASQFMLGVEVGRTKEPGATRLIIVYERVHVGVGERKELSVRAVDDDGVIDRSRDDLVNIEVTSLNYRNCLTRLDASTIRLQNGTGSVTLTGTAMEMLRLTAVWREGRSELRSGETLIQVGCFEGT
jgi:DNA/RNA endonuclease YhcR with UshA esterase domain